MLIPNEIKVCNKIPIYNIVDISKSFIYIEILNFIEVVPYDSIISDLTNFGILVKITSQEAPDRFI